MWVCLGKGVEIAQRFQQAITTFKKKEYSKNTNNSKDCSNLVTYIVIIL